MSKLLLAFTDVQINNYQQFNDLNNTRLKNTLDVVKYMFEYADKNKIEYILFSGDLFDTPKALSVLVMNSATYTFKQIFKKYPNIKFIAISGNHDQATKQLITKSAETSLGFLDTLFDNFILIDNQEYFIPVDKDFKNNKPIRITGIPYYEYPEQFSEWLTAVVDTLEDKHINIALTHQTPSNLGNPNIPVDIDIFDSRIQKFDLVLNGHIHKHEQLAPNFIDVGSPLHRDSDDEGQDKGFIVLNGENPTVWKFISLSDKYPQIITKYAGDELSLEDEANYIKYLPIPLVAAETSTIDAKNYSAGIKPTSVLESYCQDTDNNDKLTIGIKLIKEN